MSNVVRISTNTNTVLNSEKAVEQKRENSDRVFAGKIGAPKDVDSLIEQKRNFARKQAFRLIGEAWDKDVMLADSIKSMESEKAEKAAELRELEGRLNDIEEGKSSLMEEYNVSEGSQEQKDLELLEKYQDYKNGAEYNPFSKEEIERLKELQNTPRTEYQNRVLQLNDAKDSFSIEAEKLRNQIKGLTESVIDTKSEQAKSQEMVKAENAADTIMDATEDEIVGTLIKEGMENIDEKQEEEKEKAEEAAEKKEENEERIEEQKEERKEQQELIEKNMEVRKLEMDEGLEKQYESSVVAANKTIQKILEENHLIDEDLKGIEIDFEF